jgi:hypothetical protein
MARDFIRKAAESTFLAHFHASETSAGKSMMVRDSGGSEVTWQFVLILLRKLITIFDYLIISTNQIT